MRPRPGSCSRFRPTLRPARLPPLPLPPLPPSSLPPDPLRRGGVASGGAHTRLHRLPGSGRPSGNASSLGCRLTGEGASVAASGELRSVPSPLPPACGWRPAQTCPFSQARHLPRSPLPAHLVLGSCAVPPKASSSLQMGRGWSSSPESRPFKGLLGRKGCSQHRQEGGQGRETSWGMGGAGLVEPPHLFWSLLEKSQLAEQSVFIRFF